MPWYIAALAAATTIAAYRHLEWRISHTEWRMDRAEDNINNSHQRIADHLETATLDVQRQLVDADAALDVDLKPLADVALTIHNTRLNLPLEHPEPNPDTDAGPTNTPPTAG